MSFTRHSQLQRPNCRIFNVVVVSDVAKSLCELMSDRLSWFPILPLSEMRKEFLTKYTPCFTLIEEAARYSLWI